MPQDFGPISRVEQILLGTEINTESLPPSQTIEKEMARCLASVQGDLDDEETDLDLIPLLVELGSRSNSRRTAWVVVRLSAAPSLRALSDTSVRRSIVLLTERVLPDLAKSLRLGELRQNHEKFDKIQGFHSNTLEAIGLFSNMPATVPELLAFRNSAMTLANNGRHKHYLDVFSPSPLLSMIETVFLKLKEIDSCEPKDFHASFSSSSHFLGELLIELDLYSTFVIEKVLRPFVAASHAALKDLESTSRAQFVTSVNPLSSQKRYPLQEEGRSFRLRVPLDCTGPGTALNVTIYAHPTDNLYLPSPEVMLGDVNPGKLSATLDAMVIKPNNNATVLIEVAWSEVANSSLMSKQFQLDLLAQQVDVDWAVLQYEQPYSTEPAEGEEFVGRREKVSLLAHHLLRNPIVSFYITGQKRVGKTSLAKAAASFAAQSEAGNKIYYDYLLWGSFAHEEPRDSLRALGETIRDFLVGFLIDRNCFDSLTFEGSLAGLIKVCSALSAERPDARFVLIIDEFDEIHADLYRQGRLAETFFANLRALSTTKNLSFVLIGGENMPFVMDRQGQKLNKFLRVPLDYYSRDEEWDDYVSLVREPALGKLTWHEDAIMSVYNSTNGNPFFTKIVCGAVYTNAVRERDQDVTQFEVQRALSREIDSFDVNSFVHLWQDGALNLKGSGEEEVSKRSRTLVAIARVKRLGQPITIDNISKQKHTLNLTEGEIPAVVNEFCRRGILADERPGVYRFLLPLFADWLVQVGLARLTADSLGDELAAESRAAEDAAFVKDSEIVQVTKSWPLYQGREITVQALRLWLEQTPSTRSQRLLFKILQKVRFFREQEVRALLKAAHSLVLPSLPLIIRKRASETRQDVLVTYIDGEGKSGQYYSSRYAEENLIAQSCVFNSGNLSEVIRGRQREGVKTSAIVVIDDIIATGRSIATNLQVFIDKLKDVLEQQDIPIYLIALCATIEGDQYVRRFLDRLDYNNITLRVCEIIDNANLPFHSDSEIWTSADEAAQAKALCEDVGSRIYRRAPLGFGQSGLLVVFPNTTPNNSLPILHSAAKSGAAWEPLFPRLVN